MEHEVNGIVDGTLIYPEQRASYWSELYDREASYIQEHGE